MNLKTGTLTHHATLVGDILLTGVGGQSKEDYDFALNCTYIAKKEADKQYNSNTQPGPWIDYFADLLYSYFWKKDEMDIEYVQPNFSGTVGEVWMKLARPWLSPEQVSGVNSGLSSLEAEVDLLKTIRGLSGKAFDFKLIPVSYNANGDMELVITNVRFIKSTLTTSYLFWKVHQPMSQLDIRARRVSMSRRVIEVRRPLVEKAIKEMSFDFAHYEI